MKKDDNFIMLPTVDFCFAGLMENAKVRKGFLCMDEIFQQEDKEGV